MALGSVTTVSSVQFKFAELALAAVDDAVARAQHQGVAAAAEEDQVVAVAADDGVVAIAHRDQIARFAGGRGGFGLVDGGH